MKIDIHLLLHLSGTLIADDIKKIVEACNRINKTIGKDEGNASSLTLIKECVNDEIWRETKFLTDYGVQKMVLPQQTINGNGPNN
jgi:hypothetical protein